jgi:3-hydroxyisobutyrate dehydrogenase-like beta-hydroxyacid dehydrogenase
VRLAVKDLGLVREITESSRVEMPLLDAAQRRMEAVADSHGDNDLAALYELGRHSGARDSA